METSIILFIILFVVILPSIGSYVAFKKGRRIWAIATIVSTFVALGWFLAIIDFVLKPKLPKNGAVNKSPSKSVYFIITIVISLLAFAFFSIGNARNNQRIASIPTPTARPPRYISTPPPISAWNDAAINSICLSVSYPQINQVMGDAEKTITKILHRLGMTVLPAGSACDATLDISLTGKALSAEYGLYGALSGEICYQGAETTGQIALRSASRDPLVIPVHGKYSPGYQINEGQCITKPESAPFHLAWQDAVIPGLAKIWGTPFLVQALGFSPNQIELLTAQDLIVQRDDAVSFLILGLNDQNPLVRRQSANALAEIKDSHTAIPALISALSDEDYTVRSDSARTLGIIAAGPESVPALLVVLDDPEEYVRIEVIEILGRILSDIEGSDSPYVAEIVKALYRVSKNDPSSYVRDKVGLILNCSKYPDLCTD